MNVFSIFLSHLNTTTSYIRFLRLDCSLCGAVIMTLDTIYRSTYIGTHEKGFALANKVHEL